jgi:hypothetical protein
MTRDEIEATDWARTLYVNETADSYFNIIERLVHGSPVFIAWMGDSAEITLGSYTIHSTATMVEALEWCAQFGLPVLAQPQGDIVPKLLEWLDEQGNDRTLSTPERAAYFNVQATINRLMREAK